MKKLNKKLGIKTEKAKPQKSLIWDISDKLEEEIENNSTYNDDKDELKIKLDIKCNKCGNQEEFELS